TAEKEDEAMAAQVQHLQRQLDGALAQINALDNGRKHDAAVIKQKSATIAELQATVVAVTAERDAAAAKTQQLETEKQDHNRTCHGLGSGVMSKWLQEEKAKTAAQQQELDAKQKAHEAEIEASTQLREQLNAKQKALDDEVEANTQLRVEIATLKEE